MTFIKTSAIAIILAASFGVIATSASAQTTRAERTAAAREARAEAQLPYRAASQRAAPINGAAWNAQSPNQCMTDDGYGRFSSCHF